MTRLKLLALLVMLAFIDVRCKCTASQSNKRMECSALFFDSIGFYNNDDDADPLEIMFSLTTSWSYVEKFCENFEELRECLGPAVIANCVDLKKDIKSMSDYIDLGYGFLYTAGNYVCGEGHETLKNLYSCGLSECKIDDSTCQTIKDSIDDCYDTAILKCGKKDSIFLGTILTNRECFKNPDCGLCGDSETAQQVKEYYAKMNVGKKEKNNILKEFSKAAQSDDVDLQLDAITKLRKQLSAKKISKDAIVKEGYLQIFVKYLASKSADVKAEAASALKHFIDESTENLEAIIESKIIPALFRTLILTDENVFEKVIETLAMIISKHPSLRNLYIDLHIVESLLISHSSDILKRMHDDMARILVRLLKNDDLFKVKTLSPVTQKYTSSMLPVLSELIYSFDSKAILSFINDIFVSTVSDRADIIIEVDIVDKVYQLLFHQDKLIRQSAFFTISIFPKNEKLVLFENGILKFIKNEFKDDKTDITIKHSALLFLTETAENEEHIQAIFNADLIPFMIAFLNPKHETGLRMLSLSALCQISKHGTSTQISTLVDLNIIPKICQMLQYSFSKYSSDDDDEQSAQMGALLTINALSEKSQKALLQFKENNGKEILQQFLTKKDKKLVAFMLLNKLEMVDDIYDEDDVDQNDRDKIVNEGLFSNFVEHLSSKSSDVQAEAASAIKNLIDGTPENLEAILESEIIPALIRTLILTDEIVLENVIETLATIISKHPSLRNTYIDLNIVEPLLMSYSPDISAQMGDDMVRILVYLPPNDVVTFSSKTENYVSVSKMIPVLSELIYSFDSNQIIYFIQDILVTKIYERNDILIDIDVIDKVSQLLFQEDDRIRESAFFIIMIIRKCEANIQRLLENGILKFIKNEFKYDEIDDSRFLFLYEIAENKNHIQAIFDVGLIPSIISLLNPKHGNEFQTLATYALFQISEHGTPTHIATLVDLNIISKICQILQYSLNVSDGNNEDHGEQRVQSGAILTIYKICKENQKALLQLDENNGKEILQRLLTRKHMKPFVMELLERLKKVENIDVDEKRDRYEL